MIRKNYFALNKTEYERGLLSSRYNSTWSKNLSIREIAPTYENLKPLMHRLSEKWDWEDQPRYTEEVLREKLAQEGSALYLLCDDSEPDKPEIGYALVSVPPQSLKDRFWKSANDTRVIEIDNLGLFPNHEGGGRGKAYFEMLFDKHFQDSNVVYWSQHETHSPTLRNFYKNKMGMTLLAHDYVADFRKVPQVA